MKIFDRNNARDNSEFPYRPAPVGSPDDYELTSDVQFIWKNAPLEFRSFAYKLFNCDECGCIYATGNDVFCMVRKGFFFAVSVAPNFVKAMPAACCHDWLYEHSELMAKLWGCSEKTVLKFADQFFYHLMDAEGFSLKHLYYWGVRVFGYAFHRISQWWKK